MSGRGPNARPYAPREDFINAFYDHASTTYGGPPSIFSLLLKIYARFEALRMEGNKDAAGLKPHFVRQYGLNANRLRRGFDRYTRDREDFIQRVRSNREFCRERLTDAGVEVVPADYSINVLCRHGSLPDYASYRQLIEGFNVSFDSCRTCVEESADVVQMAVVVEIGGANNLKLYSVKCCLQRPA